MGGDLPTGPHVHCGSVVLLPQQELGRTVPQGDHTVSVETATERTWKEHKGRFNSVLYLEIDRLFRFTVKSHQITPRLLRQ